MALRGVVVHLTVLPSPLPPRAWGGAHDLMFSGHTICFCAAAGVLACGWLAPAGAAAWLRRSQAAIKATRRNVARKTTFHYQAFREMCMNKSNGRSV